ncbi:MAG: WYL domain-containing protein [Nocardioides sp.]|uniref:helix-turn-helix transcriptional regulator n=1 Tax=Nocardioides sp. TaxID=35761 RepID=UPI0039E69A6F
MSPEESPTARALLALELIGATPGITAERLGERLGVSDRAARRYVSTLREAGLRIDSVRGPYGGYRLGRGARVPLIFSTTEALGLVMAVLDGHHDVGTSETPVGAAIGKIARVLPEPLAQTLDAVRRTTSAAPDRAAARPEPEVIVDLARACETGTRIRVGYRTRPERLREMVLDPWAIVVRHARWYLLCYSQTSQARRVLRIDRISWVRPTDERITAPDLDPVATVEEHLGEGWTHPVEIHIEAPMDRVAGAVAGHLGRLSEDGAGCRLVGSTDDPASYAEQLVRLPAPFRVVLGDEVRAALVDLGRRLLAAAEA